MEKEENRRLSLIEYQVLTLVNEKQPITVNDTAEGLGLSRSVIKEIIDDLWDRGFVTCVVRYPCFLYHVTAPGEQMIRDGLRPLAPIRT